MFNLPEELSHDLEFIKELANFCSERGYTIVAKNPQIIIDNSKRTAKFEILFSRDLVSGNLEDT